MSILIAIFQSILQAISYIIPISESGNSAVFHDFAGKADGTVSAVTGVIHIGIAIGIYLAMLQFNIRLSKEFVSCAGDVIKKRFSYKEARPARKFVLMLMLCFAPMLVWLLPLGGHGFFYEFLRRTGFNGTLLDEGVFMALTGGLLLLAIRQLSLGKNNKSVTVLTSVLAGVLSVALVPVAGLAPIGGVFILLILLGVSKKQAYRFSMDMSIPVLLVMGIIEICTAAHSVTAVAAIIAAVLSAAVAFLSARVFRWLINKGTLKFVALYDVCIGAIVLVIGIVQLIVR